MPIYYPFPNQPHLHRNSMLWEDDPSMNNEGLTFEEWLYAANPEQADMLSRVWALRIDYGSAARYGITFPPGRDALAWLELKCFDDQSIHSFDCAVMSTSDTFTRVAFDEARANHMSCQIEDIVVRCEQLEHHNLLTAEGRFVVGKHTGAKFNIPVHFVHNAPERLLHTRS